MSKIHRVGIIGFGFMGKVHTFAYQNMKYFFDPAPLETELFGVCTAHEETSARARDKFGFKMSTADPLELINRPEIDIVNICSPNVCHAEQVAAALSAGKHIYCDKPLVPSGKEGAQVAEALEGFGKTAQMTFHLRFYPATLKAKSMIDGGLLGDPVSFRFAYQHSGSLSPGRAMGWKQRKEMGGGVLRDLGSHVIDLCFHFLGEFSSIYGTSRILHPLRPAPGGGTEKVQADDLTIISAVMKNGAIGTIEASKVAAGCQDEMSFEIYGTRGALRYNSMHPNFLQFYDQSDPDEPLGGSAGFKQIVTADRYPAEKPFPGGKFSTGWLRGHVQCLAAFLEAVGEGRPSSPSLEEGLYNVKITDAAQESENTGRRIDLG